MFSFFTKKTFVADSFENMVDIHCHILPGIDDGAATTDVSRLMLEKYQSLGFTKIIATPHVMEDYYQLNSTKIQNALSNFKPISKEYQLNLNASAEYLMDNQLQQLIDTDDLIPLSIENHLLVEMSFFMRPIQLENHLFQLNDKQFKIVMAHPERYEYLKTISDFQALKEKGCNFQLNLLSISGHYGTTVQKKTELLLQNGFIDFIGTDAHRPEHLTKIEQLTVSKTIMEALQNSIENTKAKFS